LDIYQTLINSVSEWTEEIVTPAEEQLSSYGQIMQSPVISSNTFATSTKDSPVASVAAADQDVAVATAPEYAPAARSAPTEAELEEIRSYVVGTWLQLPKADGGFQQLKISWISGISGSVMLVNRRGARVLVLSPAELVEMKRSDELLVFESESPVDQAMRQLLDKLKRS
ncbi:MAG: DUF1631 family protein, partial [Arenimonas sp.]